MKLAVVFLSFIVFSNVVRAEQNSEFPTSRKLVSSESKSLKILNPDETFGFYCDGSGNSVLVKRVEYIELLSNLRFDNNKHLEEAKAFLLQELTEVLQEGKSGEIKTFVNFEPKEKPINYVKLKAYFMSFNVLLEAIRQEIAQFNYQGTPLKRVLIQNYQVETEYARHGKKLLKAVEFALPVSKKKIDCEFIGV